MYILKSVFGSNIVLSTLIFHQNLTHKVIYISDHSCWNQLKACRINREIFKSILGRKAGRAHFIVFPISGAEIG